MIHRAGKAVDAVREGPVSAGSHLEGVHIEAADLECGKCVAKAAMAAAQSSNGKAIRTDAITLIRSKGLGRKGGRVREAQGAC